MHRCTIAVMMACSISTIGYSTFLRIELGKWFLGRSRQNEFMQSNNFHLQLYVSNCNEVEAWANNCENKASLWTDFKNSFAWLTGMTKLIFGYKKVFGSGHFLIFFQISWIEKWLHPKKLLYLIKNQFFSRSSTMRKIFKILSYWGLIFTIVCPSL